MRITRLIVLSVALALAGGIAVIVIVISTEPVHRTSDRGNDAPSAAPTRPGATGPTTAAPVGFLPRETRRTAERDASDPGAELAGLDQLPDAPARGVFLRNLFERLARGDAPTAIRVAVSLPPGHERDLALATLLDSWSATPGLSLSSTSPQTGGLVGAVGRKLIDDGQPDLAATVAREFLDGPTRADLLGAAAGAKAAQSPREAFLFGESLVGGDQDRFIKAFARGWATSDPDAAAEWAKGIDDPAFRDQVVADVISPAAEKNPAAAATLLETSNLAANRSRGIQSVASQWAAQDTEAAFAWARSLSDTRESQLALGTIGNVAPVGVGISVTAGNEGPYPRIAEVVPGGPAARSGSLKANDRIVAFTDKDGIWIDTNGMNLNQIVSQIRGQPGTGIQLRLLSANDANPSQARTVAITREQILLKN